jgi:hypothetical protein
LRCADVERDIVDAELEGEHVVDLGKSQSQRLAQVGIQQGRDVHGVVRISVGVEKSSVAGVKNALSRFPTKRSKLSVADGTGAAMTTSW